MAGSANAQYQCVDLANAYIRDVLNLPIIEWTNAQDFPKKAGDNYEYIENTPEGVPEEGDLVIFSSPDGVGHISIFIEGTTGSFRSFDQNYPTESPCHVQGHYYKNVIGWLHPKGGDTMGCDECTWEFTDPEDNDHKERTGEWLVREFVVAKEELIAERNKRKESEANHELCKTTTKKQQDTIETLKSNVSALEQLRDEALLEASKFQRQYNYQLSETTRLREELTASDGELKKVIEERNELDFELSNALDNTNFWRLLGAILKRVFIRRR